MIFPGSNHVYGLCFGWLAVIFALSALPGARAEDPNGAARLFILSGQSNMVGLNPNETFRPTLEAAFPGDEIVIVKDAENGQPLARWFAREAPRDLYHRLMSKVSPAVDQQTFKSISFVWMQGEADGEWAADSHRYEKHMEGLIAQLRGDLQREDLIVLIGRISGENNGQSQWDHVREIQVRVAEMDTLVGWINTDDLDRPEGNVNVSPARQ